MIPKVRHVSDLLSRFGGEHQVSIADRKTMGDSPFMDRLRENADRDGFAANRFDIGSKIIDFASNPFRFEAPTCGFRVVFISFHAGANSHPDPEMHLWLISMWNQIVSMWN